MSKLKQNFKSLIKLVSIVSLPFFALVILGWFIISITYTYLREVLAFGFLTVLCCAIVILFSKAFIQKRLAFIFTFILSVLAFIKLSFYYNYGVKLSASALYVIFETYSEETSDYLINYFNFKVIGLAILFLIIVPFVVYKFLKRSRLTASFKLIKVLGILAICASVFIIHKRFKQENLIYTTVTTYNDFNALQKQLKSDLAKPESKLIKVKQKEDFSETHVVIIGESTSSWHMQLYGYDRKTNPKLTEIRDELLVFDSVISPNVHTIVALDKIFTFSDFNNPSRKDNSSIVQLANQAGFETYWISNQRPVGFHESTASIIASGAKETHFIATDNSSDVIYDENLFPTLDTVLKKEAKKKIIFMHLIGTHSRYKRRYPEAFNEFIEAKKDIKYTHEKAIKVTNEYDNATLYNDFIVREIIEKVRRQQDNSYVLYLSDHGDEMYDTKDMYGHNEYHATRPMYEVPFVIWLSDKYKQKNELSNNYKNYIKRPYILEDFIHSFADLSRIKFMKMDSTKSIFNSGFEKKSRLIKDSINYDKYVIELGKIK